MYSIPFYGPSRHCLFKIVDLTKTDNNSPVFCHRAVEKLKGIKNVEAHVHDLAWAESKKMGSFISVSRGSSQPLRFLEVHYKGAADKNAAPLSFVGKGITFDSGEQFFAPCSASRFLRRKRIGQIVINTLR
jgi:aminopeptidase